MAQNRKAIRTLDEDGWTTIGTRPKSGEQFSFSYAGAANAPKPSPPPTMATDTGRKQKQKKNKAGNPQQGMNPAVEQELDDLIQMTRSQRQLLLKGPRITVLIGDQAIRNISKRAAMAVSSVLNEHFTKNSESLEYRFPAGHLNQTAVHHLLVVWIKDASEPFEAVPVSFQSSFRNNVQLLRAARFLGMERYTKGIMAAYVDYVKTYIPSYDEITTVEMLAPSDKDPLYTSMVNHLCYLRTNEQIPDVKNFQNYLEEHPKLKKSMESAQEFFAGRFEARRQNWLNKEKVREMKRDAVACLRVNMNDSGVHTISADQARAVRRKGGAV